MAFTGPLSKQQKKFCQEYVKDFSGQRSAIAAGYSAKCARSMASQLLTRINIQAHLATLQKKIMDRDEVEASEILKELLLVARADMANYLTVDKDGAVQGVSFDELRSGATRLIKKIKQKKTIRKVPNSILDETVEDNVFEFELHDKMKALELLGRHKALFTDNHKFTGFEDIDKINVTINIADMNVKDNS